MINLDREICFKIREARRTAGLSHSSLSREVGCKQSALSMFEQGDGTKLNEETIKKLCAKFKIELPKKSIVEAAVEATFAPAVGRVGFCPNPSCPAHVKYFVDGKVFLQPTRERQDPAGGKFCAVCGEVLEKACPNCGAPVHDGAVCTFCGIPYIALV